MSNPDSAGFLTVDRVISWGYSAFMTILYFRHLRVMRPYYSVLSKTLIRDYSSITPGIEVRFGNAAVPNLTLARIAIWNGGREPIDRTDIAESDPLTLMVPEGVKILAARTIQETSPPCAMTPTISADEHGAVLEFEFLNHEQGCVLEVLHTGASAEDVTLAGIVKGKGRFQRVSLAAKGKEYMLARKHPPFYRIIAPIVGYGFPAIIILIMYLTYALGGKPVPPLTTSYLLTIAIVTGIWAFLLWLVTINVKSLPEGLGKLAEGLYGD